MKKNISTALLDITGGSMTKTGSSSWQRRLLKPWGLLYTTEGSGCITFKDKTAVVSQYTLAVYKPEYEYTFHYDKFWRYIWFHFPVRSHMLDLLSFDEVIPGLGIFSPDDRELERITRNLDELRELEYFHWKNWEELALNLIENILIRVCMRNPNKSVRVHKMLNQALKMLTSENCPPIEEIAGKCGISVSAFYNTFAQELGCSPRRYREQHQLRNARNLLLNSTLSLDEIAESCGFCNRYYMSERFKKLLGVTPGALRKNRQL